jgi:hypothetical protein
MESERLIVLALRLICLEVIFSARVVHSVDYLTTATAQLPYLTVPSNFCTSCTNHGLRARAAVALGWLCTLNAWRRAAGFLTEIALHKRSHSVAAFRLLLSPRLLTPKCTYSKAVSVLFRSVSEVPLSVATFSVFALGN